MRPSSLPSELAPHLALLGLSSEALTRRYDARFAKYIASYGHPETFLMHQAESFSDVDMRDATVLDFGCGFGLIGAAFAALGAKRVIGIDMDEGMIRRGRALMDEWLSPSTKARVELVHGSIFDVDLAVERFDVITAIESLSHVQSVRDALQVFSQRIAPRGRVLVSDGNNRFYWPGRRRRRRIWDNWEQNVAAPARQTAIAQAFGDLDADALARFVAATIGLSEKDAVAAVRKEREEGIPPVPAPSRRMVHPKTGYHEERELDPFELIRRFEEVGFVGELLPPHSNYPPSALHPKSLFKRGLRWAYPVTLAAFPGFRLRLTNVES